MSLANNEHDHQALNGPKTFEVALGLDDFIKKLERDFFATAKFHCKYDAKTHKVDLVIHLYHNFSLHDCLRHMNNGDWGKSSIPRDNSLNFTLQDSLKELNRSNSNCKFDIAELSLYFEETSVIVSRLYEQSISTQIGKIIAEIGNHYVFFTKGLTEMPYEIFVPVFEEDMPTSNNLQKRNKSGYFDYWGLYYDNEHQHQAMIYSLRKKKLYQEDLFLFE
ncbi:hypothetical protein [Allomuricauda sp. NBRC 101325]|uniref:hypothetical protein n=1 Tax=Allomuricauda sp. NBRC 101325 TaxID=1113758 RepID=UPI0024A22E4F|nr:hypothetical protein [Muricauda sp. NBRC 101325]GLU44531.1 hypothetical protein Musp01_21550 [Muricauda sp. NBRC 101325]